jgi:hypothetical protein
MASDEELTALYNGPLCAADIANRLAESQHWVYEQWERLRRLGLVERRRPSFRTQPPQEDFDYLSASSELLIRLQEAHPEGPRFDIPPALSQKPKKAKRHAVR